MEVNIERLDHVAIQVRDLERSLGFYMGTLGLRLQERTEVPERRLKKALLAVGLGRIELIEYENRPIPTADGPVAHIALEVQDIEEALAELSKEGVSLEDQKPREIGGGMKIAFLRGPDQELIELVEKP
jgi:methylmalonyl-CoA epimerase